MMTADLDRCSGGPPDVDGLEGPAVRMTHVQESAVGRAAPLEDGHLIPGGTADRHELQPAEHTSAGHLQDTRSVRNTPELREQLHIKGTRHFFWLILHLPKS